MTVRVMRGAQEALCNVCFEIDLSCRILLWPEQACVGWRNEGHDATSIARLRARQLSTQVRGSALFAIQVG